MSEPLTIGDAVDAQDAISYLRAQADFRRSWMESVRKNPFATPDYIARNFQDAEDCERWARAIEKFLAAAGITS
jgi:hypothetical protein